MEEELGEGEDGPPCDWKKPSPYVETICIYTFSWGRWGMRNSIWEGRRGEGRTPGNPILVVGKGHYSRDDER